MLQIRMLPAERGDCLWIEYGDPARPHRVMIDGGPLQSWTDLRDALNALPKGDRRFELLVVTHVDLDHIEGVIRLLNDPAYADVRFDDVWFNGWEQLNAPGLADDSLGGMEGEYLSGLIRSLTLPLNQAFGGGPVVVRGDELVVRTLSGGLRLTLLSPTAAGLRRLRAEWAQTVRKAGLEPGDTDAVLRRLAAQPRFEPEDSLGGPRRPDVTRLAKSRFAGDHSAANASSIALLAEYDGKAALLNGDAHAPVVADAVRRLLGRRMRLPVGAVKLSHHGSKHNTSPELLELLHCPQFLFSSNGSRFGHPDPEAIAWTIAPEMPRPVRPTLVFNYRTDFNRIWDNQKLRDEYGYDTLYPPADTAGVTTGVEPVEADR